jgi:hypothetical protein
MTKPHPAITCLSAALESTSRQMSRLSRDQAELDRSVTNR